MLMDGLHVQYHHLLDICCPVIAARALFKAAVDVILLQIMEKMF